MRASIVPIILVVATQAVSNTTIVYLKSYECRSDSTKNVVFADTFRQVIYDI